MPPECRNTYMDPSVILDVFFDCLGGCRKPEEGIEGIWHTKLWDCLDNSLEPAECEALAYLLVSKGFCATDLGCRRSAAEYNVREEDQREEDEEELRALYASAPQGERFDCVRRWYCENTY